VIHEANYALVPWGVAIRSKRADCLGVTGATQGNQRSTKTQRITSIIFRSRMTLRMPSGNHAANCRILLAQMKRIEVHDLMRRLLSNGY
jgi:hypothetical protein